MIQGSTSISGVLTASALKRLRGINAVKRFKAGQSAQEIAEQEGVGKSSVYRWIARYRNVAKKDIKMMCPNPGRPPRLTKAQREQIHKALVNDQASWSIQRVVEYAASTFKVTISKSTAWRILKSLSLIPEPLATSTALKVLKSSEARRISRCNKLRPQVIRLIRNRIRDDHTGSSCDSHGFSNLYVSTIKGKQQYSLHVFRSRNNSPTPLLAHHLELASKRNLIILSLDSLSVLSTLDTKDKKALQNCFVHLGDDSQGCTRVVKFSKYIDLQAAA